jgi:hypothetical protein
MLWLAQHESDIDVSAWCALDDAPGNWMSRSRLLLTDFKRGFTEEDADALRRMLNGLRVGHIARPVRRVSSLWT